MNSAGQPGAVSVIGLGNMGSALTEALLAAGFEVRVWNRTRSKSDRLVEQGAILVESPVEAASQSENILVCVTDHEAFASLIHNDALAVALEGKCLIQLGVVTAEESRQTDSWAQARSIQYLEVSILGLPLNINNASAMLVCSGHASLFESLRGLLSVCGDAQLVSETAGSAYDFDKIYYAFAYTFLFGFFQGAALAKASGFSIEAYTEIVLKRLPVAANNLKRFGGMIADRNHDGDQATLTMWADGFAMSLELCRKLGVDDSLPGAVMQSFEKAKSAGYGGKEISAIFEVLLPETAPAPTSVQAS
jgi:3-hydroxyisobutyrate dehydrogenase-like beta-hydroxyacid dehydrogenase